MTLKCEFSVSLDIYFLLQGESLKHPCVAASFFWGGGPQKNPLQPISQKVWLIYPDCLYYPLWHPHVVLMWLMWPKASVSQSLNVKGQSFVLHSSYSWFWRIVLTRKLYTSVLTLVLTCQVFNSNGTYNKDVKDLFLCQALHILF